MLGRKELNTKTNTDQSIFQSGSQAGYSLETALLLMICEITASLDIQFSANI